MEELIRFLVENITGQKNCQIDKKEVSENYFEYILTLPEEFIGLVIGKAGKTINAIRQILKVRATLENTHFHLTVEPSGKSNQP